MATTLFGAVLVLYAVGGLRAQQAIPTPHIGYIFPAGGRQGATFEVKVGGQFLQGASEVFISGQGVHASVLGFNKPLTQQQASVLREKVQAYRKSAGASGAAGLLLSAMRDPQELKRIAGEIGITEAELRAFIEFFRNRTDPKRQLNPQIAEAVTLQVSVDSDAAPGDRELRLLAASGLTNPLRFQIGQLPEVSAKPKDDSGSYFGALGFANGRRGATGNAIKTEPAADVAGSLPVTVNGRILPGEVERYAFMAHKGQKLIIAVSARELVPYLADAVPGWFQAVVALYDSKGVEVAYADHFKFHPDPVLRYVVPEDGRYEIAVRDALYRGREDFVYRATIGELPYITGIYPLGGRATSTTGVEVFGWNLPVSRLVLGPEAKYASTIPVFVSKGELLSNSVPFAVDSLPECMEKESNDRPSHAQSVSPPIVVNGRIRRPGDVDVFRFQGRAGQTIVAEVVARRLGSPLDSVLTLTDASGRQLAMNDDFEDPAAGLITHQADSRLSVRLPASGAYYLTVRDAEHGGGSDYGYRLRIGPPRPDFELRVTPSSVSVRAGASAPITVYALRRDGFSGEISLELKDAPKGFILSGARIPADKDEVRLTVTAPPYRLDAPIDLRMEGRASVQGREILHTALPADNMMQAFAYHHLVPSTEWMVAVGGRRPLAPAVRLGNESPVRLPSGGTTQVRLLGYGGAGADRLELALNEPPDGIEIQNTSYAEDGITIDLRADAGKVKPGFEGNLIVDVYRDMTVPATAKRAATKRRLLMGSLPAIPFEVIDQAARRQ